MPRRPAAGRRPARLGQLSLTWTKATSSAFADRVISGIAFLDDTTVIAVGWDPTSGSYSTVLVRGRGRAGGPHQAPCRKLIARK